jgi:UDP-N-acetylmuramyl pentapeptide phosphotransferase/UDP-N-acetylglucosamine-1-phosphate transferase
VPSASIVLLGVASAVASAWLTRLAIAWAEAAGMGDDPGARRMHQTRTVRGAGIGFVAILVGAWGGLAWAIGLRVPLGVWAATAVIALLPVAIVSWIDDRRGLGVAPRLAAHSLAALVLLAALVQAAPEPAAAVWLGTVALLLTVPSINFWNFIDGIDGMAASQAILAAAAIAMARAALDEVSAAWFAAVLAGAVAGFLPYNAPRARAFMGDVGSASLGFALPAVALAPGAPEASLLVLLAVASPVYLDTGLTLAGRMLRRPRRQWYTAHREHLYQWLARSQLGHPSTTLLYAGWSLGPGALVAWIGRDGSETGWMALFALYVVGALSWCMARGWLLARARRRA